MGKKSKAKKVKPTRRKTEPADWQEAHSPTVEHTVRGDVRHGKDGAPKREVIGVARRRKHDAELYMDLDPAQMQAAEELRAAYMAIVGGVSVRGVSFEQRVDRQRGSPTGAIADADLTTHHRDWVVECRAARPKVDVDAVHEVICDGFSLRTVNEARGRRSKTWAGDHVRRGLALWDAVRPKRKRRGADSRSVPLSTAY